MIRSRYFMHGPSIGAFSPDLISEAFLKYYRDCDLAKVHTKLIGLKSYKGNCHTKPTMSWYVIHTKPRQEHRALLNLQQQGYNCYLPLLAVEKLRQGALMVVQEPLFPRYLFIQLDTGHAGQSWGPIRSTLGVSRLVTFGMEPATIHSELVEQLRSLHATVCASPQRLFNHGDLVQIKEGPFAGIEGVYQMDDGDRRAMVLIELLSKPSALAISPGSLRKIQTANPAGYPLAPRAEQTTLKALHG